MRILTGEEVLVSLSLLVKRVPVLVVEGEGIMDLGQVQMRA
jgi:hypothetical protein